MNSVGRLTAVALVALLGACGQTDNDATDVFPPLDQVAERYVKLILAIGEHEPGYVDAYYGPEAWLNEVAASTPAIDALELEASTLIAVLQAHQATGTASGDVLLAQRIQFLIKQLIAAEARTRIIQGVSYSFDEETRLLFDAVSPGITEQELETSLATLEAIVPGEGPLNERIANLRQGSIVPTDRVDAVFQAAMQACRTRTADYLALPEGEAFTIEYVTDQPWSAYNWYQGKAMSLIQVNLDQPFMIERAIDLGCHEGYPGHHVFNAQLESELVNARGWMEFSVYPLYSPLSLLAEGTANLGIQMAFPGDERRDFEKAVLYPLAGLEPGATEILEQVAEIFRLMRYSNTEIARRYLDGKATREEAIEWTMKYSLSSRSRAEQSVAFIEFYRGYVINYVLGMDLAVDYVDRNGGIENGENAAERWRAYEMLLSTPLTASMLED